nr:cytochrome d ubiquinol oxidase subunit II [Limnobacter sp. SAORIC-690]
MVTTGVQFGCGHHSAFCLHAAGQWLVDHENRRRFDREVSPLGENQFLAHAGSIAFISAMTPLVVPEIFEKWFSFPNIVALAPIPIASVLCLWGIHHVLGSQRLMDAGYGWMVFALTAGVMTLAFMGLAYSQYPYVVLNQLTVWEAASSPEALKIILVGVVITLPTILGYTAFSYKVFWGKAKELSYQ